MKIKSDKAFAYYCDMADRLERKIRRGTGDEFLTDEELRQELDAVNRDISEYVDYMRTFD